MLILVINAGSTSIKLTLVNSADSCVLLTAMADQEAQPATLSIRAQQQHTLPLADTGAHTVLATLQQWLQQHMPAHHIDALAHRMVHGGTQFHDPLLLDRQSLPQLQALTPLAPLHHPPALAAIEAAIQLWGRQAHYALFDTAFYRHLPEHAFTYALPAQWRAQGMRRFGFHGWSHQHALVTAARHLGRPAEDLRLISIHLGGGASISAIKKGRAIDTSMGLTPSAGLVMATRCGDIDPMIPLKMQQDGLSAAQVEQVLNHQSGLLGLCGSEDMRTVLQQAEAGDSASKLAIDIYCYAIRKYVGAYYFALDGADAIVFTAGVGEHSPVIRQQVLGGLSAIGIELDPVKNASTAGDHMLHSATSCVSIFAIHTEEEIEMARSLAHHLENP